MFDCLNFEKKVYILRCLCKLHSLTSYNTQEKQKLYVWYICSLVLNPVFNIKGSKVKGDNFHWKQKKVIFFYLWPLTLCYRKLFNNQLICALFQLTWNRGINPVFHLLVYIYSSLGWETPLQRNVSCSLLAF